MRIVNLVINPTTESKEPAFLQRLRGEYGGEGSGRHERPLARPRKLRDPNDLDDDAPTYVDEQNQDVVSKEAYETLISKGESTVPDSAESPPLEATKEIVQAASADKALEQDSRTRNDIAAIGGSRKRRQAKVVQAEDEAIQASHMQSTEKDGKASDRRKTRKKIKLSFEYVDNREK